MNFKPGNILLFLLGFLSLGAFYGGILLILSPSGKFIGLDLLLLRNSPFSDFLLPGIILLFILGSFRHY